MMEWWSELTGLNQLFFALAVFFSTLFVWQLVSAVSGLADDHDVLGGHGDHLGGYADHAGDAGGHGGAVGEYVDHAGMAEVQHASDRDIPPGADADDLVDDVSSVATFRLLSLRSILAFAMLFSWAAALYLQQDLSAHSALLRALLWGVSGMVLVAAFFWLLPHLTEEGTAVLESAVGQEGVVYIDIPAGGVGQVRVVVGGRVQFVAARSTTEGALRAGIEVRVVAQIDAMTLEVEPMLEE